VIVVHLNLYQAIRPARSIVVMVVLCVDDVIYGKLMD
jgi:hypothetical protein